MSLTGLQQMGILDKSGRMQADLSSAPALKT
jgi:hypothetical protein